MRAVLLIALLAAGCSHPAPSGNGEVDLNGAADRAKGDTQTYAANVGPAAAPAAPVVFAARYRCMDGAKIAVRVDDRAHTVAIIRDRKPLATLEAAGGSYRKGGYELRGQGDDATLTTPGLPPIACRAIR